MVDVAVGLQGLKASVDMLKALVHMRDGDIRLTATFDLKEKLVELLGKLEEALRTQTTLLQQIDALEAEVARLEARNADLANYELKEVATGAVAYMTKPAARGVQPAHWLCPTCYENGKKSLFQPVGPTGHGTMWRCMPCRSQFITHDLPHWL